MYHTLYQWPVWGRGLRHGRTAPARPEAGGGSRSALPVEGRKVARLDGRGGRACMTGLTGGRARLAAGSHDVIPSESVTGSWERFFLVCVSVKMWICLYMPRIAKM